MSKVPPPVLGFNNNVRHRGRVFHIQTEDSGAKSPRIVTHLFADGGRIIKTARIDYSEHVGGVDLAQTVRQLMKAQHKAMFSVLKSGELDALLESACGPLPLAAPAAEVQETPSTPGFETPASVTGPISTDLFSSSESELTTAQHRRPISNPSLRRLLPSVPPPTAEALDDAVSGLDAPSASPLGSLHSEPPWVRQGSPPLRTSRAAPLASAQPERAIVSRPASRYGSAPTKSARSIFGDGVISEKSLDEVILSYLAEDLEGSSE